MEQIARFILLSFFFFCFQHFAFSQDNFQKTLNYIRQHYPDLAAIQTVGWIKTNESYSQHNQTTYLYFRQTFHNTEIFNANVSVALKNGEVVHFTGLIVPISKLKIPKSPSPAFNARTALLKTAGLLQLNVKEGFLNGRRLQENGEKWIFDKADLSLEPVPVKLVYLYTEKEELKLAWDISIYEVSQENWWSVRLDAQNGELLERHNWVTHCSFGERACKEVHTHLKSDPSNLKKPFAGESYKVFGLPIESPNHGNRSLLANPFNATASPFGWHDTNGAPGAEFTITRGNNVHAYEDRNNSNTPGFSPDGGNNLQFDFAIDLTGSRDAFRDASITNLFYWNNIVHDVFYFYGFDEQGGNFQANNYGKGGLGNDPVRAEAQDGSGLNNANFSTPPDGNQPRMQMFLWGTPSLLRINTPAGLAGVYQAAPASFGARITETAVSGDLVLVNDGSATPTFACVAFPPMSLTGKIALIDRGTCSFTQKVKFAQDAGAIGVIVVNNVTGDPITMGGTDATVTIPSIMVTLNLGNQLKTALGMGVVNVSLIDDRNRAGFRDSSFDSGIVAHEYGHGISIRLTGGPANSNCLNNEEQMGEGWSDYFGLILTMKSGDTGTQGRGVGTYAANQPFTGRGIRPFPYSTDMNVNPLTYNNVKDANISVPHGVGTIWCTMLWDMTWALIDKYGFDPDWYNGKGGNNIALRLVMDALKLQPCSPGFVDGRDAILKADQLAYNGTNQDLIWQAFARRGLGFGASQGASTSRSDGIANSDLPPRASVDGKVDSVFVKAGNILTYTFQLKSNVSTKTESIKVNIELLSNLSYEPGSASNGGVLENNSISFPSFFLEANQTLTRSFKARVKEGQSTTLFLYESHETENDRLIATKISGAGDWIRAQQNVFGGAFAWFIASSSSPSEHLLSFKKPVFIMPNSYLSFYHRFKTEDGYDGGVIEVSSDNGLTWKDVGDLMIENNYPKKIAADANSQLAGKFAFTGDSRGYLKTTLLLTEYAGKNILIRFRFLTDEGTAVDGWSVDDIYMYQGSQIYASVRACVSSNQSATICSNSINTLIYDLQLVTSSEDPAGQKEIRLFPNPASDEMQLFLPFKGGSATQITLQNLQGRVLYEKNIAQQDQEQTELLPLKNLSKGIYLLTIASQGKSIVKKIVVQ